MTDDDARARLTAAIVRLGSGDKSALEYVYRATSAKLFGICLRILGDRKEAEDALQEVYLSLYRRADRFDPARASPISWIAVFARNRAIDRLRRLKARPAERTIDSAAIEHADGTPLADELMIDVARDARIHACLDALDDGQRTSIRAAFFGGQTYAELAEKTGTALGTMKSRIRRGLARLKTCLESGE
ncbi:sigma-70 family RNA polymerase sigma factor [Tsuneonella sp. HG249]